MKLLNIIYYFQPEFRNPYVLKTVPFSIGIYILYIILVYIYVYKLPILPVRFLRHWYIIYISTAARQERTLSKTDYRIPYYVRTVHPNPKYNICTENVNLPYIIHYANGNKRRGSSLARACIDIDGASVLYRVRQSNPHFLVA